MVKLSYIALLPALGALINGIWVMTAARLKREPRHLLIALLANLASFGSFFMALLCVRHLVSMPAEARLWVETLYAWIPLGDLNINVAFQLDPLSSVMILIITGVGSFIHLYSAGYMSHDHSQGRYFVYLNMFLAAMLVLVLGANLPLMFVGWEGVGLCSYLLIGFWYSDPVKASAGKKAFVVNRVGDLGFLLGIFFTFVTFKTLDFVGLRDAIVNLPPLPAMTAVIAFCLFIGACGKSAQFPLHVWLPDAMAGPTPVSALIHAATMVTAGVYMIARLSFLYASVPDIGSIVATVGVFTALFAALIALVQNDIKKVLAYSTVSQLGFMFLGVGVGGYTAGVFHLMTHAFFKALLFLGAGSVIHAMSNEQDMRKMGGLRKHIPITFWTFIIGWAAILGLPPFSGFFSKDEILWTALEHGYTGHYLVGLFAAGLTAFYMTRAVYLTFFGESRLSEKAKEHLHESPLSMTIPLMVLALLSFAGGFLGIPGHHFLEHYFEPVFAPAIAMQHFPEHHLPFGEAVGSAIAVLVGLAGAALAYALYGRVPETLARLAKLHVLRNLLENKFYIDEIYESVIVKPVRWFSEFGLWKGFDVLVIDGFINAMADVVGGVGAKLRLIQTGQTRVYALGIALGAASFITYLVFILMRGF